jgi:membrane protein YdbS with pleckstrin-like domain
LRSRDKNLILWEAHPSSLGMLDWYFKWVGIATAVSVVAVLGAKLGAYSMVFAVLIILAAYGLVVGASKLMLVHTTYQVTRDRVYTHTGILRKRVEKSAISRIQNVTVDQSLIERLLKVGRVDFETAGENIRYTHGRGAEAQPYMDWWGIRRPEMVAALVDDLLSGEDPLNSPIVAQAPAIAQPRTATSDGAQWRDADDADADSLGGDPGLPPELRDDIVHYDD